MLLENSLSDAAKEVLLLYMKQRFIYSMLGLVLGSLLIACGSVLCLLGVTGSITWVTSTGILESHLADASPGVVLFVVGLFIIFITRHKLKVKTKNGDINISRAMADI